MKSEWEGPMGDHEEADVPLIFRRVRGDAEVPLLTDLSGMGNGGDESPPGMPFGTAKGASAPGPVHGNSPVGGAASGSEKGKLVRMMARDEFRSKLITHFSIKWERGEIVWPSRNGIMD